ncbi:MULTISPECIES: ABC transporter permease [Nitratireductor]|uniref:ABC transporter permease n=1 Tax=Nitratireductor TaxID=245876 RepID=UPI000D0E250E|nr:MULTISPECIES: ABC transporter permease [Nitratireductor]PSM19640.1 organic solvent ABC transporter permease [Nitratireductor sp. StC3]
MLTKERNDASAAGPGDSGAVPSIDTQARQGVLHVALAGPWTTHTVGLVDAEMRRLAAREGVSDLQIDLTDVSRLDTAGAWVIKRLAAVQEQAGARIEITGEGETDSVLLAAVEDAIRQEIPTDAEGGRWGVLAALEGIGRLVYAFRDEFLLGMHILGATISGAQMKRGRGHGVNPAAIVHQIDRMGVGAIPVILLMSAIVGAIVAQQGAFQLRYFGAEIFVVDLVGILVLREMGVLLTAIMIAGRSGSAITAEIGSMKMREEIDALTVIGLNPVGVLVFPRLVALLIALPCLTIAANFAAVGGAMAVSYYYSGIAPSAFIDRMRSAIDLSTIFAGLIKAPFMALIIGVIASVEGIKVGGSAESLGSHVTAAVVKAIFVVIVVDGIFAMFYAAIGF